MPVLVTVVMQGSFTAGVGGNIHQVVEAFAAGAG